MTTVTDEIVVDLTDEQRRQIIRDHIVFQDQGVIGECLLREVAKKVADRFGGHAGGTVLWMEAVANSCYRYYAMRYLENN